MHQSFYLLNRASLRLVFTACTLSTLACTVGPASESDALVLVVIDTLRGDRLGCTGYTRAQTPNLDRLARNGVLFLDAMSPVPVTLPSVSSLLTGRYPHRHGVRDNDTFVLASEEVTLAESFRESGWRTAAVLGSAVLNRDRGLDQGFESYDDAFGGAYPVYDPSFKAQALMLSTTRRRADRVTDLALERVTAFGQDSFFLMVHYFDVHMVYDPPPEFAALHPGRPYDGEVSFTDHEVGRLVDAVRQVRPGATVMVVSDHGESQNEHGEPQHGFLLYQSTLHVPVIMNGPGVPGGLVRYDPVSLVDLEPTLCAWFGLGSGPDRDGRVLSWERESSPVPLYAETLRPLISYGWHEQRALRWGRWKIIQGKEREIYNLLLDPGETDPLGATSKAAPAIAALEDHVREDEDPETVFARTRRVPSDSRTEILASLGYVGNDAGGRTLSRRPDPREALPGWVRDQTVRGFLRIAGAALEEGNDDLVQSLLDSLLVLSPENPDVWFLRGKTGGASGSLADFERVLSLDPDHGGALRELANRHLQGERFEEALPHLRRLSRLHTREARTFLNLGIAAERLGRDREAEAAFNRYLELRPDGPQAESVRAWLDESEPSG